MSNKYIAKLLIMADTDYSSYYLNLPIVEDKVNLQTNVVEAPLALDNPEDVGVPETVPLVVRIAVRVAEKTPMCRMWNVHNTTQ